MGPEQVLGEKSKLNEYLRVLRRRKWIVLAAVTLVPLGAVLLSVRQPAVYQASAEVLLSRQNLAASLQGISDPDFWQTPERAAATQADLARVPTVAERTIKASGTDRRSPGQLLGSSSVVPKTDSDLLLFFVQDTDPALAVRLATEYARQFTIYRRERDTAGIVLARNQVDDQIAELEADGDTKSALYASLIDRQQQLLTLEALQTSNAFVVRAADGAFQVAPTPVRNGILGLALGLLLGLGLVFLREALDTRLRTSEEVAERLGLPMLARLPEPPRRLRGKNRLSMLAEPHGVEAEAFRMLRTNLDFVNLERGVRTIMITSAVATEGKSTTAANLAVALARTGRRIVLADLDLRRPFLDRFFRLGGRPGLTDVALGHVDLNDAIASVAVTAAESEQGPPKGNGNGAAAIDGTLEVLPSGPIPPNPGEFVGSQTLTEILDDLRERADVVIIDTPPLLQVGDAMTLSAKVDALVLVARLNVVRRPMLNEVQRLLEASPAAKLGFVLTGAELEDAYGYGYGGYYYRRQPSKRRAEREAVR